MRVWELPVTDLVINAVEAMAESQGIKSLKLNNRNKTNIYPADWIAGVDYENQNDVEDGDDRDYEEEVVDDNDELDEDDYDRVDQQELDDILSDRPEVDDTNPTGNDNENPVEDGPAENNEADEADDGADEAEIRSVTDSEGTEARRSGRTRSQPERLTYSQQPIPRGWNGKKTKIRFEDGISHDTESCHNLKPADERNEDVCDEEYKTELAMVIARFMVEINSKATVKGASYAQQYILQKGLKVFGGRGTKAATKEVDQLHQRTCFTPMHIGALAPSERKKAMEALMFLTEKRDKTIKGRLVYNGKPTSEKVAIEG